MRLTALITYPPIVSGSRLQFFFSLFIFPWDVHFEHNLGSAFTYFSDVGRFVRVIAKQARAKALPYPRQIAASAQSRRTFVRRDYRGTGSDRLHALHMIILFVTSVDSTGTSVTNVMRLLRRRLHHRRRQPRVVVSSSLVEARRPMSATICSDEFRVCRVFFRLCSISVRQEARMLSAG